jgi:putative OPT family oligopeptide transporter
MAEPAAFRPYVSPADTPPELTARALVLGSLLGVVFGAATTYLALRVGLSVSASVPIAVLAVWALKPKGGRAILEHNIVQTAGSAGESVAAAVVFTVPALIFLGWPLEVGLTTLIALTGGVLGVLMMVPLRRYLIVKEHGRLRYPEGRAAAEILQAGEQGGTSARKVFTGLAVGVVFKALQAVFGAVPATVSASVRVLRGASVSCDFAPELVGVGYILGWRTSVMMAAGGLLASFVLIPLIIQFGSPFAGAIPPAIEPIAALGPDGVWDGYVRHIGAGAVAAGGLFALARALPSIGTALAASIRSLGGGAGGSRGAAARAALRTERDAPQWLLVGGTLALVAAIWALPAFQMNALGALLILGLGFLFSVVSSRITGEVGSTSCPLSGMTIGVLMAACGVFLLVGWEGSGHARLALVVGAVVCIAISNAGTCSQDLKTGFLLGATPVKQQAALLVGVLTSILAVGWTAYLLNEAETVERRLEQPFAVDRAALEQASNVRSRTDRRDYAFVRLEAEALPAAAQAGVYLVDRESGQAAYLREDGIGSGRLRAPQAKLMSVVIDGLLTRRLPWDLILLGAAIAVFVELLGIRSLTFAVGVYLPLAATMPVFVGGAVRALADRRYRRVSDAEEEPEGTLYTSGLIAGAAILGILAALQSFLPGFDSDAGLHPALAVLASLGAGPYGSTLALCGLAALCWMILRAAAPSGAAPSEREKHS